MKGEGGQVRTHGLAELGGGACGAGRTRRSRWRERRDRRRGGESDELASRGGGWVAPLVGACDDELCCLGCEEVVA